MGGKLMKWIAGVVEGGVICMTLWIMVAAIQNPKVLGQPIARSGLCPGRTMTAMPRNNT
jgi:hypothetical protein